MSWHYRDYQVIKEDNPIFEYNKKGQEPIDQSN
jgi:hypothetical protein